MPHFFFPINWLLTTFMFLCIIILTMSLIPYLTPKISFPANPHITQPSTLTWKYITHPLF